MFRACETLIDLFLTIQAFQFVNLYKEAQQPLWKGRPDMVRRWGAAQDFFATKVQPVLVLTHFLFIESFQIWKRSSPQKGTRAPYALFVKR